jgi:hypothetical protein
MFVLHQQGGEKFENTRLAPYQQQQQREYADDTLLCNPYYSD